MKVFLALFGLLVAAEAVSFFDVGLEEWNLFKLTYKKNYTSDMEDKFRLKVFLDNKHNIAKHNLRYANGLASYKLEMNQFGDMLHHEFISKINGFNKTKDMHLNAIPIGDKPTTFIEPANVALPKSVDWRTKGAVTPVKNQGQCGSCWSFSATGALEGQHFRKLGKLVSLSEQNLIDCSGKYGNDGCHGGRIDSSFQYIKDNRGIDTERAYPYEAKDDQCRYNPDQSGATDNGFVDLPEGDEQKLMAAVATVGPVSVAIDASHESFQFYHGDVYYEPECSSTRLDHGVLVVGYGTDDNGNDYWLVKNSWDTTWGDDGSQKWDFYTGALEGQHFRKLGKLVSLSEQNLIDCSGKYGNDGCHGGRIDSSFQYIKDNRGIDTERAYPYEAKDDQCRYNPDQSGATDNGFVDLPEGDEQKLMAAVATVGPVSVAIDASHESLQFYHGDVYYEPECSSTRLDHGVLVVGYGTDDNGNDYWLVKNSWDTTWGDDGYIKMARNRDNNCGIASSASYPLV